MYVRIVQTVSIAAIANTIYKVTKNNESKNKTFKKGAIKNKKTL